MPPPAPCPSTPAWHARNTTRRRAPARHGRPRRPREDPAGAPAPAPDVTRTQSETPTQEGCHVARRCIETDVPEIRPRPRCGRPGRPARVRAGRARRAADVVDAAGRPRQLRALRLV